MEYEDEDFRVGESVIRFESNVRGDRLPELSGTITHVYRDGVRIVNSGLPFFLSRSNYGKDWFYCFDFAHLEGVIAANYRDRGHIALLAEGWGLEPVLAAAKKVSHSVFLEVQSICLSK